MRGKSLSWIVGAAVLGLILAASGWLLLISPMLQSAAQTRSEADEVVAQNVVQQERVNILRAQFENMEVYEAELAVMQEQVPTAAELIEFVEVLGELAEEHEVLLTMVSAGGAEPVLSDDVPELTQPDAPAEEDAAEGDVEAVEEPEGDSEEDVDASDGEEAPAAPELDLPPLQGFSAIPFNVSVLGSAGPVRDFMADLQFEIDRLFVVERYSLVALSETDASGGRPDTELGDVEVTITGRVFVLADDRAPEPEEDLSEEPDDTTPPSLPEPGNKNPFAPSQRDEGGGTTDEG